MIVWSLRKTGVHGEEVVIHNLKRMFESRLNSLRVMSQKLVELLHCGPGPQLSKKKYFPSVVFSINEALGDLDRQLESMFKRIIYIYIYLPEVWQLFW